MTGYEVYECMKRAASERTGKKVRDADVARGANVHKNLLYEWKSGRSNPKIEAVYRICKYLNTSIAVFCDLAFDDKTE